MRKFQFFFLLFFLISTTCLAQVPKEQEAINKDVWYNFMQAYRDLDASLFNEIHTDDVLRVSIDQGQLLIGQEYKDKNLETFNNWNSRKLKQKILFSFLKRIQKGDWAHEVGIFRLTRYNNNRSKFYYGKFNVTLKKIDGTWKIYIDSDTYEEGTIGESDFIQGDILKY